MQNLLITGGSGYVGTRLINYLLQKNHKIKIVNYDLSIFGDEHLPKHKNFKYVKNDLRNIEDFKSTLKEHDIDTVLHLACISNDPTFELDSDLSKRINFDCFEPLVKESKQNGVKKFIYISTCSVYGISDNPNVDENHKLVPMTDYNKYKALCEPILMKYLDDNFHGIIIRPATVCGFSEKMRFDLTVNILTNYAYNKGFIRVFGGQQSRPNVHIDDMCRLYEKLIIENFKKFNGQIFNFGHQNMKIIDIANEIKEIFKEKYNKDVEIKIEESQDKRSYNINSEKIKKILGFNFKYKVKDAIIDLIKGFEVGQLTNTFDPKWQNIAVLKKKINDI